MEHVSALLCQTFMGFSQQLLVSSSLKTSYEADFVLDCSKLFPICFFQRIWECLLNSQVYLCTVGHGIVAHPVLATELCQELFPHLTKLPQQLRLCSRERAADHSGNATRRLLSPFFYYHSNPTDSREQTSFTKKIILLFSCTGNKRQWYDENNENKYGQFTERKDMTSKLLLLFSIRIALLDFVPIHFFLCFCCQIDMKFSGHSASILNINTGSNQSPFMFRVVEFQVHK